jgi:hypothetical protein
VDFGRIVVCGQPRQKISKTHVSINKLGMVVHAYALYYTGGINRRIKVQDDPDQNLRSYLKNN